MELQLTELLNLPSVVVEWSRNFGQELILDVEIDAPFAPCPNCQKVSYHLHQNHLGAALLKRWYPHQKSTLSRV
jgi:hypothetical protein